MSRLRLWGRDEVFALAPHGELVIGSDPQCAIWLADPSVLPRHARLARDAVHWLVRDLGGGLRVDGAVRDLSVIEPGAELEIGRHRLVAESARSIALRRLLARVLGWDRDETVDLALRAMRLATTHRAPLMLCGQEDLVPIARELHRIALGDAAPFVVCDPRRRRSCASVRSAANVEQGVQALRAAAGGTLCLRRERLPHDATAVLHALREPATRTVLVVCARGEALLHGAAIVVPPLSERAAELDRIIDELGADARARFQVAEPFTEHDRDWIRRHSATSLAEIAKGTLRLMAIRTAGNAARAAQLLDMSHVALTAWLQRRRGSATDHPWDASGCAAYRVVGSIWNPDQHYGSYRPIAVESASVTAGSARNSTGRYSSPLKAERRSLACTG